MGAETKRVDGAELLKQMIVSAKLLPPADELEAYARACDKEEAVGPIFYPDAYMRGRKRLRAVRDMALAGAEMARALEGLRDVTIEEFDPELDSAAQKLIEGFHRRATDGDR